MPLESIIHVSSITSGGIQHMNQDYKILQEKAEYSRFLQQPWILILMQFLALKRGLQPLGQNNSLRKSLYYLY